jgi:hypothetical protein
MEAKAVKYPIELKLPVEFVQPGITAEKIEDSALTVSGYTITVNGNKVIFTADTAGAKSTSLNITVVDK